MVGLKNDCWAKELGDCKGKISGEHFFSDNLFEHDVVTVQGFDWCVEEPSSIGLASFTRNVLCGHHNSSLSPIDSAGGDAYRTLKEVVRMRNVRDNYPKKRHQVKRYRIHGRLLERWFLKSLINVATVDDHPIGPDSAIEAMPSDDLVRIAYGLDDFVGERGLYLMAKSGTVSLSNTTLHCSVHIHKTGHVAGSRFTFFGFPFYLNLRHERPLFNVTEMIGWKPSDGIPQLHYHPSRMQTRVAGRVSQVIEYDW